MVLDDMEGKSILGPSQPSGDIHLHKFEIKPFKATASSVVKLLARPERVALTLLDKLGVRFVTRNVYDCFRVIRFLVDSHIISYPHIMPDQSNNTLYPVNLFLEVAEELRSREQKGLDISREVIDDLMKDRFQKGKDRAQYLLKGNEFSGPDYRFIKFITRKLITVRVGPDGAQRAFRFFYPYEVQIIDTESHASNLLGPMAHDEYKKRQRHRARERVLGSM
jgi:uncharacterized protein (TIGR04562 family)